MVTKRLYEKEKEWSRGQIKTCRKTQHVKIDNMKEMPNSICGNTAVGGNYNSTCDKKCLPIFKEENKKLYAPLEITIYPTLRCNLQCRFCFLKNRNKSIKEINVEEWIKLIKEAYEIGVLSISILGGEPTQYKQIDQLLSEIDMIGINITITSNGVNIKESTQNILVNSKHIIPIFHYKL